VPPLLRSERVQICTVATSGLVIFVEKTFIFAGQLSCMVLWEKLLRTQRITFDFSSYLHVKHIIFAGPSHQIPQPSALI
jgi:hypothetical protein